MGLTKYASFVKIKPTACPKAERKPKRIPAKVGLYLLTSFPFCWKTTSTIPENVTNIPRIPTKDIFSPKAKKAIIAPIAGLLDIRIIVYRGPISFNDLKRNVSPKTKPIIPLKIRQTSCKIGTESDTPKANATDNNKTEETHRRDRFKLNEPIRVTTTEKIYGEIDQKIAAPIALSSPIKFCSK